MVLLSLAKNSGHFKYVPQNSFPLSSIIFLFFLFKAFPFVIHWTGLHFRERYTYIPLEKLLQDSVEG